MNSITRLVLAALFLVSCGAKTDLISSQPHPQRSAAWDTVQRSSAGALNVLDFGAKGDGLTDDAASIQSAVNAAQKLGLGAAVHLPAGNYRIGSTLDLESVLLIGLEAGGWSSDARAMPHLIVDTKAGEPVIRAKVGSSIHGLVFDFLSDKTRAYGPGIKILGNGISVTNVVLHRPTYGIVTDGGIDAGRTNLENIFIVNPIHEGIRFEFGMDIITMRNIEVWNYEAERLKTTTGFVIGHADEIRISDCAVVAAKIGFHFIESQLPPPHNIKGYVWGGLSNTTVDFAGTALKIDAVKVLRINGGSFWAHHFGIVISDAGRGAGDVIISGVDIRSNSDQNLHISGNSNVTITGSSLKKDERFASAPKVLVAGQGMVNISSNNFDKNSLGIFLSRTAKQILIQGNLFERSSHTSLIDEADDARKLIQNNLFGNI